MLSLPALAQRASVSTDALGLLGATPNIELSAAVSDRITVHVQTAVNPFESVYAGFSLTHLAVSAESNYWLQRPYYSHGFGVNALASIYEIKMNDLERKGMGLGLGLVYSYGVILSRRWALVPSLGVGCVFYEDAYSGERALKPALTKLKVGFCYIID